MKKSSAPRRLPAVFFCVPLLALAAACSTIPKSTAERGPGDFDFLPEGGRLYLWANVREARPLLESVSFDNLSLKDAGAVLDRADTAAAVFTGNADAAGSPGDRFFASLRGNFPVFQAGVSMTFSSDWKKQRSTGGNSFWYSGRYGIGLALASRLALVSGGDPFARAASPTGKPAVTVPSGFEEFREGAVMSGWIPEPELLVNEFLVSLNVPIQLPAEDFFFNVNRLPGAAEDSWRLTFRIRTPSVNQARALVTLFSLARTFIDFSPPAGIAGAAETAELADFLPVFFANLPEREEDVLTLESSVLTLEELSLLFGAVSVYSQQQ